MSSSYLSGTALVTGASTGIGAAYADRLRQRGHDLLLVARDAQRLEALATQLRGETGVSAEVLRADLTDRADRLRVEERLGNDPAITMLINNAGASLPATLVGTDLDWIESVIALNVLAFTRLATVAATRFAAAGGGTIVTISSSVALTPEGYGAVYGGTKAHILNFSISLAGELRERGVRVQVVLPGATRTEIWERSGKSLSVLDPARVMEAGELVDAALAGLDLGEVVTIPSLADTSDWDALSAARSRLAPNLSHAHAAERYRMR